MTPISTSKEVPEFVILLGFLIEHEDVRQAVLGGFDQIVVGASVPSHSGHR